MMKKTFRRHLPLYISLLPIACLLFSCGTQRANESSATDPASYINPFIGTVSGEGLDNDFGKTFPGATTPFGLVQLNPTTVTGGDNAGGYRYYDVTMEGFCFAQMSGTGWYGDLGNFLVTPTTGPLKVIAGREENPEAGYRSRYSKQSEKASAGYYTVTLTDYNIKTEVTAAPRSGMLRFTFPENEQSRIQIDLARRTGGTSTYQQVQVVNDSTIEGWMRCTPEGGGFGDGQGSVDYTVYFHARFTKPLKDVGVWSADIPDGWKRIKEDVVSERYQQRVSQAKISKGATKGAGKHIGFYSDFTTGKDETVLMKVGISFVDVAGARNNLEKEIPDWDFERVHRQAVELWNEALSKVEVTGGTEDEKAVFYTAMYHSMLDPRVLQDVDGRYPDGDGKIYSNSDFRKRTIFSGWDVFRAQFPLLTIINPPAVNDMINSLNYLAERTGKEYYPRWELMNAYTTCMIGNPAVSVLADAYQKGIRDYNIDNAFRYAVNSCEKFGNGERGFSPNSISETLEYAYFDWCLSVLANSLGKQDVAGKYLARSKAYKNIFDPSVDWFRPRNADGSWQEWPEDGRLTMFYGSIECNPYQQGWFVPQDIEGMVNLFGGRDKVLADLENFFEQTPQHMQWNKYYNHSNEPVHHVAFLFNHLQAPWLTQKWTRFVCDHAYKNSVEGLVGNEDVGQMSAWYILAAGGLYQVSPGDLRYEITSPVFDQINFKTSAKGEKIFSVVTKNNSKDNIYIQSASLNGKPYNKCHIGYNDIFNGGTLELVMGREPNKNWGIDG